MVPYSADGFNASQWQWGAFGSTTRSCTSLCLDMSKMQSNHYLLHFRTILGCPRGSKKVPKSIDFCYAAPQCPPRRPKRPPKSLHESPMGTWCASKGLHGSLMDPKLEQLGSPKDPFCSLLEPFRNRFACFLEVRQEQNNWREFRPCLLLFLLECWPQSTQ